MAKHKIISIVKFALFACLIFLVINWGKKNDAKSTVTTFPVHNMEEGFVKIEILAGQCEKEETWKTGQSNLYFHEIDNGCISVTESSKCNVTSIQMKGDEIPVYTEQEYEKYRFVTSVVLNLQALKFGRLVIKLLNQWRDHFCWVVTRNNATYYKEFHSEFDHIFHNNWKKLSILKTYGENAEAVRSDLREIVHQYFMCLEWKSPDEYKSWRVRFLYEPEMYDAANLKAKKDTLDWNDNDGFPMSSGEMETEFHNGKFTFELAIINMVIGEKNKVK